MGGIDKACCRDDSGAVLVIMENRDIELIAQFLLDNKAFRRANIFEINSAKCIPETLHAFDEFFGIFFFDLDVKTVYIRKAFEENRFPFHDGL